MLSVMKSIKYYGVVIPCSPLRYRNLFLISTFCVVSLLLLYFNISYDDFILNNRVLDNWNQRQELTDSFTIHTEGCTIPALNPFDENVVNFTKEPINIKPCKHVNNSLLGNNETHIWINRQAFEYYDITPQTEVSCCYRGFYRSVSIADITASDVDERVTYKECTYFSSYILALDEFVHVFCDYKSNQKYSQLFLFAHKKLLISPKDDINKTQQNQTAYNVIVIGIDSVSRMNFYRTMPKTISFLKSRDAIELKGYNKVGDNTFPNLIPMLLGIGDDNLKKTCLPSVHSTFDNCPFVWEWFKQAGFYTALAEDTASLGTFNYLKNGFSGTPTDYYTHTFMGEAEREVGNNKDGNSYLCMGDKYFFQVLLDYIENLTKSLKQSKLFGFFWEVTMTHDYLNYPTFMDKSVHDLLKKLCATKYLDDTILILLSDHGIRWGDIRNTKQGRLEERLPFAFFLLPPTFQHDYSVAYNNLKLNRHRLTTPFDIHATLLDLVSLDTISNENIRKRSQISSDDMKSTSLFMQVPANRTCQKAGIKEHWCTCHRGVSVALGTEEAQAAGSALVDALNALLRGYSECAELRLATLLEATELVTTGGDGDVEWREFQVVVRTAPGNGVFEATLRRRGTVWQLAGSVSRLNLYADQSRCMHYHLKLYCFCL